ncbi:MAG: ATPase, T2SS/T4P/T4SS family [Terriglobia bacterium]
MDVSTPPPIDCEFRSDSDFTFYRKATPDFENKLIQHLPDIKKIEDLEARHSLDAKLRLRNTNDDKQCGARVNACRCFSRKYWSLNCRLSDEGKDARLTLPLAKDSRGSNYVAGSERKKGLNSVQDLCDVLYDKIIPPDHDPKGLVVVAGATKCAKSEITRGFIYRYLTAKRSADRSPHLITLEDPIEKYYHKNPNGRDFEEPLPENDRWLDYTPREKGKDTETIQKVLDDCLRQKPTVVFIGETRTESDWRHLIRFAGTGHLVLTTTHAGSLTEAMGRIFTATKTTTAQQRGEIAESLLALIHLKSGQLRLYDKDKSFFGYFEDTQMKEQSQETLAKLKSQREAAARERASIILPALWVRTPKSAAALTDSGRASLLPNRWKDSCDPKRLMSTGCLGRTFLAQQLLERLKDADSQLDRQIAESLEKEVKKQAIEWDLAGV